MGYVGFRVQGPKNKNKLPLRTGCESIGRLMNKMLREYRELAEGAVMLRNARASEQTNQVSDRFE